MAIPLTEGAQPTVLVAEDDHQDLQLLTRAFRKAGYDNPIYAVPSGDDVIGYLKAEGQFRDRAKFPIPSLILLDMKLLGMNGLEVLDWIRKEPQFEWLPVIFFTGSDLPGDKEKALKRGANAFHLKPQNFEQFTAIVKQFADFWLSRWKS